MFQQVELKNLQMNQTYKILANNYVFKGTFKGFRYAEIKLVFEPNPHLSLEFIIFQEIFILFVPTLHTRPVYQFVS